MYRLERHKKVLLLLTNLNLTMIIVKRRIHHNKRLLGFVKRDIILNMKVKSEYENEDYEDPYNNEVYENYNSEDEYTTYDKTKDHKSSQNNTRSWSKRMISQIVGLSILAIGKYFKCIRYNTGQNIAL